MKPAPPSNPALFGSRRAVTGAEVIEGSNPKPSKFITNAEQQWYAMMASKSHADEAWAAQEKKPTPKVISSPHTAVIFRTPGAPASAVPRGVVSLRPPGALMVKASPSASSSSVLRVGRQGREVNSKTESKPVPGQSYPLGYTSKPGARPPPPMHPSMLMRKTNGMPIATQGNQKPPPPSMRKHIATPGHIPRPRGPPPPHVLARLRANGPPGHSPAHPSKRQQGPTQQQHEFSRTNHATTMKTSQAERSTKPNRFAHTGQNVLHAKPVSKVKTASTLEDPTQMPIKDSVDIYTDSLDQSVMTESDKEWIQLWDEEVESNYYYNQLTGEASWIRPEEVTGEVMSGSVGGGGGGGSVISSVGDGTCVQDEAWERYWDEDAAAHYLHDPTTGETRWESDHHGTADLDFSLNYEADTKGDLDSSYTSAKQNTYG